MCYVGLARGRCAPPSNPPESPRLAVLPPATALSLMVASARSSLCVLISFRPPVRHQGAVPVPLWASGTLLTTDEPMTDGSLTKAALIEAVAHAASVTKKRAEIVVDTVFSSIVETLHRGEKVELRGFGSFRRRYRGPHRGRNPRTGDPVDVPSKRVAYFKPGKELKELINQDPAQPPRLLASQQRKQPHKASHRHEAQSTKRNEQQHGEEVAHDDAKHRT